jgi:tetratricopeptide (TPR) repeat protein
MELSPGNEIARSALVRAYVSLGAADEALAEAERGLRELPNDPNMIRVAGIAAWMNSDKVRAQALFRRGVGMSPWDLESIIYLARTEVALENKDAARETLRRLQGRIVADVALRLVLAEVELDLGEVARAEAIFAAARTRIGGQMVESAVGLAKIALIRGERARAAEILREAEGEQADRPMALLKIARAFEAVRLHADAVRVIEGVVAARPAAVFPRTELARAYANAGRSVEACRTFDEVRGRVKGDRTYERFLAQMDVLCRRATTNGAAPRVNP